MSSIAAEGEPTVPSSPDTSLTATEATTALTSPVGSASSSPSKKGVGSSTGIDLADVSNSTKKGVIVVKHDSPEVSAASPDAGPSLDRMSSGESDLSTLRVELEAAKTARSNAENRAQVLEAELTRFKDQHAFVAAAKEALEKQLRAEQTKREAAEEKVEILRGQVEAARRGVMQLQKQEQDRAHRISRQIDGEEEVPVVDAAAARKAKRTSIYGLGLLAKSPALNGESSEPPIPAKSGLRELRLGSNAAPKAMSLKVVPPVSPGGPSSPRTPRAVLPRSPINLSSPPRKSTSPPREDSVLEEMTEEGSPDIDARLSAKQQSRRSSAMSGNSASVSTYSALYGDPSEHLEKLKASRMETEVLKTQVEALEVKLMEADEARQASEECLRALREFLAGNGEDGSDAASLRGISLPPLPTDRDQEEEASSPAPEQKAGWGFNMWRRESVSHPAGPSSPVASTATLSPSIPASSSPSIALSPPTTISELVQTPGSLDEPKKEDKPITSGFFSGWTKPAPPPPPEPEPEVEEPAGANLGRKMTSFFGRRARMGSRAAAREAEERAEREAAQDQPEVDDAPHAAALAAAMGDVKFPSIAEKAKEPIEQVPEISEEAVPEPVKAEEPVKVEAETKSEMVVPETTADVLSPEPRLAYLEDEAEPATLAAPPKPARSQSRKSPKPPSTDKPSDDVRTSDDKPRISLDDKPRISLDDKPRISLEDAPVPLSTTPVRRGSLPSSASPIISRSPMSVHSAHSYSAISSPLPSPGLTPVRGSSLGSNGNGPRSPIPSDAYDGEEVVLSDKEEEKPVRPARRPVRGKGRRGRGGFV